MLLQSEAILRGPRSDFEVTGKITSDHLAIILTLLLFGDGQRSNSEYGTQNSERYSVTQRESSRFYSISSKQKKREIISRKLD